MAAIYTDGEEPAGSVLFPQF